MTVSQCTTQALPVAVESLVLTSESGQGGIRKPGLFDSIFAGLFGSDDPAMPEQTGKGGDGPADVRSADDAVTTEDMAGDRAGCMTKLIHPAKGALIKGMRVYPEMEKVPETGDAEIAATVQLSLGKPGPKKSTAEAGESSGEEIVPEKSLEKISECVAMPTAVLQPSGTDASLPARGNVAVEATMAKVEMPDAECPDPGRMARTETGVVPVSGETVKPEESIAHSLETSLTTAPELDTVLQKQKNSDPQHAKQQLFETALADTKTSDERLATVRADDNRGLSALQSQHHLKHEDKVQQSSITTGANDPAQAIRSEKPVSAEKGIEIEKVIVTFNESSTAGDFSEKSGESSMNAADNGKGNLKFTDLNSGMRSGDISVQTHSQPQNPVVEPSRPVSHEQIIAQVREKLTEHRLNGDSGRITIHLHPEHLGQLQIDMKMENHRLKVEIIAENQNVKEALVHNMDSLKDSLSRQNIAMDRFSVLTGGGGNSGGGYRDWRQTGQHGQPNPFMRFSGFPEDTPERTISYLDSRDNSMVDLRL
jgi:flagellar hook-length control protein FliK